MLSALNFQQFDWKPPHNVTLSQQFLLYKKVTLVWVKFECYFKHGRGLANSMYVLLQPSRMHNATAARPARQQHRVCRYGFQNAKRCLLPFPLLRDTYHRDAAGGRSFPRARLVTVEWRGWRVRRARETTLEEHIKSAKRTLTSMREKQRLACIAQWDLCWRWICLSETTVKRNNSC